VFPAQSSQCKCNADAVAIDAAIADTVALEVAVVLVIAIAVVLDVITVVIFLHDN